MKQTLLTICLIVFALPSWSGVGDVYYCESEKIINIDVNGRIESFQNVKFKISASEDKITVSDGTYHLNSRYPYKSVIYQGVTTMNIQFQWQERDSFYWMGYGSFPIDKGFQTLELKNKKLYNILNKENGTVQYSISICDRF